MTLDIISKHSLLIGFISILAHIPELLDEIPKIIYHVDNTDFENVSDLEHLFFSVDFFLFFLTAIVTGIFLICGILKRKHWLLLPWLIVEIVHSVGLAKTFESDSTDMQFKILFIVLQPPLFYPVCYLFFDMRQKNAAVTAGKLKN